MEDIRINLEQVVSIRVLESSYSTSYTYKKASGFWLWKKKEGFYKNDVFNCKYVTIKEIESDKRFFVKDTKVKYKPHIEIYMSNGRVHEVFFETTTKLNDYISINFGSFKHIKQLS